MKVSPHLCRFGRYFSEACQRQVGALTSGSSLPKKTIPDRYGNPFFIFVAQNFPPEVSNTAGGSRGILAGQAEMKIGIWNGFRPRMGLRTELPRGNLEKIP